MNVKEVKKELESYNKLDNECKFEYLRMLSEDVAQDFTSKMELIDDYIDEAINKTSRKELERLGINSIKDITTNIDI